MRDQERVVGHAVRAMYLYSGMADVAAEFSDGALSASLERLWRDLASKNLYITGGLGPSKQNEGFTRDYDPPNTTAYAETCAAVGLVFWSSRMLGLGPDRRYADVMERALYSGALSGLSVDGSRFFYENPLRSNGDHHRWTWHSCPCCPPNIARLVASIGGFHYSVSEDAIAIHLYCDSTARCEIQGNAITLTQATRYPWDGHVEMTLATEVPTRFGLYLRLPGWSRSTSLSVNGVPLDVAANTRNGYAYIEREWRPGDRVELVLELSVERNRAHPDVRADAGRVAISRGPLVYCLESVDSAAPLQRIVLPAEARIEPLSPDINFEGTVVLGGSAEVDRIEDWGDDLYRQAPARRDAVEIRAIPYFLGDNREPDGMEVWLREG